MKMVNLWELSNITDIEHIDDINKLLELIRTGEVASLTIKDKFELGSPVNSTFESIFAKKGAGINYVSTDKPILISNNPLLSNFISPSFYKEHEKEIKEAYAYYYEHTNSSYISIPSFAYSPELIDVIIKKKVEYLDLYDVDLTDEIIKKLKDNFISAYLHKNGEEIKLSSNRVIGHYTLELIEKENKFIFSLENLVDSDLDNVKYLGDNSVLDILSENNNVNEKYFYIVIKDLIEHLNKTGKHFVVNFKVENRSVFKEVFNEIKYDNIEMFINNDLYNYPYDDYLEEEKRLDKIVEPIKKANLSPLERYLAVYNIVKNFKPYKENPNQTDESRYIRYILDNEYMVCVGYARLLEILCEKVGIRTTDLSIGVDISYDKDQSVSEIPVKYGGHARCMVSMDDPKYDVHGLFISDPTWDNKLDENRLNHALMTSGKIVTGKRMVFFDKYEHILDINTFEDFNSQVNYLYKRHLDEINKNNSLYLSDYFTFQEQVRMKEDSKYNDMMIAKAKSLRAYNDTIKAILKPIACDIKTEEYYKMLDNCKKEEDDINLLTEIGNYLLTRINQPISSETIIRASVNATSLIKGLSLEEREQEYERTRKDFYDRELTQFPYKVEDPDELGWKTR